MPAQKSRRPKEQSGRRRGPPRQNQLKTPVGRSVLILECDSAKLAIQSLSMADEIAVAVRLFAPGVAIEVVKSATEQMLQDQFGRLAQLDSRFRIVVVVGHSSEFGLQLTSDRYVPWNVFAKWVEPFKPRQIVLIACKAGQILPAASLFQEVPTLTDAYGSPFVTTKEQVHAVKVLVPYLLNARAPDGDLIRIGQIANFLLTRGAVIRWRRGDFRLTRATSSRRRVRR